MRWHASVSGGSTRTPCRPKQTTNCRSETAAVHCGGRPCRQSWFQQVACLAAAFESISPTGWSSQCTPGRNGCPHRSAKDTEPGHSEGDTNVCLASRHVAPRIVQEAPVRGGDFSCRRHCAVPLVVANDCTLTRFLCNASIFRKKKNISSKLFRNRDISATFQSPNSGNHFNLPEN